MFKHLAVLASSFLPTLGMAHPPEGDSARLERIESMYKTYALAFPKAEAIDAVELQRRLRSETPPVVVDVRPLDERKVSTLPGAIASDELLAGAETYRGRDVVVYCTIGARSGNAVSKLRKEGFDVLNFRGSLLAWTHVGGELVDAAGVPTKQVHVYGKRWNLLAEGYEAVVTDKHGVVVPL